MRWIDGYERMAEVAARLAATRLAYVADRESDIVALMAIARDLGHRADWLVRSQHNRTLPDGEGRGRGCFQYSCNPPLRLLQQVAR